MLKVTSNFDGGNIEVISCNEQGEISLKIRKDTKADFYQWFYFRVTNTRGKKLRMKILNAAGASYPEGWENYKTRASYDKINWFVVPTNYDGQVLAIEHTPAMNSIFYSYFAPYSYEQHLELINNVQFSPLCNYESIGQTIEGRDIDLLTIGKTDTGKKKIWIIARQHPGESMASWFIEGFLNRIIDIDDPVSRSVLNKAVFYIIPFINPDGAIHGNLRANAAGVNLNREWANPDQEKSPEVYHILNKMDETGVDMNLDIHGDEGLPYNFISSIEGIPSFDKRLKMLDDSFKKYWLTISPDFQVEHGYPKNEPGKANLNICAKQIGERFKCLSMTVEMPFIDNANLPDTVYGWSPERSEKFGASVIDVIWRIVDKLR